MFNIVDICVSLEKLSRTWNSKEMIKPHKVKYEKKYSRAHVDMLKKDGPLIVLFRVQAADHRAERSACRSV